MILSLHILVLVIGLVNCQSDVVKTTKGPVQGEILKTVVNSVKYSSFKGIPYAEAPTGYNRFKPPIEKKPWTETLKTTQEGSNCVQVDFIYENLTGSEDCLYLNVYSPLTQLSGDVLDLRPVMVWIHGGTFKAGYGNSSLYGPDFIIEEGVVLVTFNYRLGPFGFMSLNHPNATGNAGLKDQNLVLRWIQQNIKKFGGNPNNVTLVGQSAGGVAVDFHSLSEMSRGLFHKSISMSAAVFCPWAFYVPEEAVKRAFKLGELLGNKASNKESLLKTLYAASAQDIMLKTNQVTLFDPPFKPTLEDAKIAPKEEKFMTECYLNKYLSGDFYQVPHLTGFTSDETVLFAKDAVQTFSMLKYFFGLVGSVGKQIPSKLPFLNMTLDTFINLPSVVFDAILNETSDLLFIAGIDYKQQILTKKSAYPVYYYYLSFETENSLHKSFYNVNLNGTAHGDDFAYLFYISLLNPPVDPNHPVSITRRRVVRMWTNFAKYGNPTPFGKNDRLLDVSWPISGPRGDCLEIGDELKVIPRPTRKSVKLYQADLGLLASPRNGCNLLSNTTVVLSNFVDNSVRKIKSLLHIN